jgi:hypothetical protein
VTSLRTPSPRFQACASRPGSRTKSPSAGARCTSGSPPRAAEQELPTRARELIGKDPDVAETFDIEATIEGRYVNEQLSRLGLAFE